MARTPRSTEGTANAPARGKQDPKVEKVGGDVDAVNPEAESPLEAAEFNEEKTAARKAEAEKSPVDFNHEDQNKEQLPDTEQLTGTGAPNKSTDSDVEKNPDGSLEADLVESAGELKNSGETAPTDTDTAVVTAANQQQKAVGALAREKAPSKQDKNAIAESPVSTPNGERVVTFTTPPRVAVADVAGGVPAEGKDGEVEPVKAGQHPALGGGRTNGVTAGLETVDSGIVPDATVAETDGTTMPAGAPNETYDGTEAPDGLYTGAELNAAPLQAPQPRSFAGAGETNTVPAMGAVGLQITDRSISGEIVDEATGEPPTDLDGLFVPLYAAGNVMVSTKRLIEKTSESSGTLVAHVGMQMSSIAAEKLVARIRG